MSKEKSIRVGFDSAALVPLSAPVDPQEAAARLAFTHACLIQQFRTRAFLNPNLGTEEYLEMRAEDSTRGSWSISPVRCGASLTHAGRAVTLCKPVQTGLNFLQAMEAAAHYEKIESRRGCVPTGETAEELGERHYKSAGLSEGLVFNVEDFPLPVLDGMIVVPDEYPEEIWKNVRVRPAQLPAVTLDPAFPVAAGQRPKIFDRVAESMAKHERVQAHIKPMIDEFVARAHRAGIALKYSMSVMPHGVPDEIELQIKFIKGTWPGRATTSISISCDKEECKILAHTYERPHYYILAYDNNWEAFVIDRKLSDQDAVERLQHDLQKIFYKQVVYDKNEHARMGAPSLEKTERMLRP